MKRIIVIFLALTTVLAMLAGCVGKKPVDANGNGLDDAIEEKIRKTYWEKYYKDWWDTYDNIELMHYYGTFNGSMVVAIDVRGIMYPFSGQNDAKSDIEIVDVLYWRIRAVREDDFYELEEAYEKGYLTKDDIEAINEISRGIKESMNNSGG